MFPHPELGSDPPIGSDRESGRDTMYISFIVFVTSENPRVLLITL